MTTEEEFLRRAIALAIDNVACGRGGPFGALIVRDGVVVGEGANSVTRTLDPTAHGEVNAIRDACARLQAFTLAGCTLYTSCEPCPMCLAACYWAGIERIVFGATQQDAAGAGFGDQALYREFSLPASARSLSATNILRQESQAAFEAWRRATARIDYGMPYGS